MIHLVLAALTLATPAASLPALDDRQKAAIAEALQDERDGEAFYADVIAAHGSVRPFSNVIEAERRHAAFLTETLGKRGLAVPSAKAATKRTFTSITQACEAALAFEKSNVALYDRLLAAGPFPQDVKEALEHNRMASQEHHIPAFERCSSGAACGKGKGGPHGGKCHKKTDCPKASAGCKKQGPHCCKREGCKKAEASAAAQ